MTVFSKLKPETARKLVDLIDAATKVASDPDCLEAFELLGLASAQLNEVLGGLGAGLMAPGPSTTTSAKNSKINRGRNFDPCPTCAGKRIRCKLVSSKSSPRLCGECQDNGLTSCDEDATVANQQHWQEQDILSVDSGPAMSYDGYPGYPLASSSPGASVDFPAFTVGLQQFPPMLGWYPDVPGSNDVAPGPSGSQILASYAPTIHDQMSLSTPGHVAISDDIVRMAGGTGLFFDEARRDHDAPAQAFGTFALPDLYDRLDKNRRSDN